MGTEEIIVIHSIFPDAMNLNNFFVYQKEHDIDFSYSVLIYFKDYETEKWCRYILISFLVEIYIAILLNITWKTLETLFNFSFEMPLLDNDGNGWW